MATVATTAAGGGPVGVIGGGRMGAGIAHAFLLIGCAVTLVETDEAAASQAEDTVRATLEKAASKAGPEHPDPAQVFNQLTVTSHAAALAGCNLVVEAVLEDLDLKQQVLAAAAAAAPDAVLASNTSSLSITSLAAGLPRPDQVIGLHFFNPVPVSDLVEIVVGAATAPEVVAVAGSWVEALGKTAITVRDSPGFASSRLGVAIALEAIRMLEEGVATAADIDTAMTLGYRHPVGPLRTTDIVGLDVRLAIAEHLHRELGPRFEPPALLRSLVEKGHLGRKSGQGFYTW